MTLESFIYPGVITVLISLLFLNNDFGFCLSYNDSIHNTPGDTPAIARLDGLLDTKGCVCFNYTCGCCGHVQAKDIHLNSTVCMNITYLSKNYGISLTVEWNDIVIYNETVSARYPPPFCVGVPYVTEWADVCMRLHDISVAKKKLHACAQVNVWFKKVLIARHELGCFNIDFNQDISTEGELLRQQQQYSSTTEGKSPPIVVQIV